MTILASNTKSISPWKFQQIPCIGSNQNLSEVNEVKDGNSRNELNVGVEDSKKKLKLECCQLLLIRSPPRSIPENNHS